MPCMKLKTLPPPSTPLKIRCIAYTSLFLSLYLFHPSSIFNERRMRERGKGTGYVATPSYLLFSLTFCFFKLFLPLPPFLRIVLSSPLDTLQLPPSCLNYLFSCAYMYISVLLSLPLSRSLFVRIPARLTYQHCICCTVLCKCNQIICHLPGQIL